MTKPIAELLSEIQQRADAVQKISAKAKLAGRLGSGVSHEKWMKLKREMESASAEFVGTASTDIAKLSEALRFVDEWAKREDASGLRNHIQAILSKP